MTKLFFHLSILVEHPNKIPVFKVLFHIEQYVHHQSNCVCCHDRRKVRCVLTFNEHTCYFHHLCDLHSARGNFDNVALCQQLLHWYWNDKTTRQHNSQETLRFLIKLRKTSEYQAIESLMHICKFDAVYQYFQPRLRCFFEPPQPTQRFNNIVC